MKTVEFEFLKTIEEKVSSLFDESKIEKNYCGQVELEMKSENVIIKITLDNFETRFVVVGETLYKANNSWWTFNRRGIEDSFYSNIGECASKTWDAETAILEQYERAEKAIKKAEAEGERIELFSGIHLSRAAIKKHTERFKKDGYTTVIPAGMGTAYRIQNKRERFSNPLTTKQKELLNIENAWVVTQDWD